MSSTTGARQASQPPGEQARRAARVSGAAADHYRLAPLAFWDLAALRRRRARSWLQVIGTSSRHRDARSNSSGAPVG